VCDVVEVCCGVASIVEFLGANWMVEWCAVWGCGGWFGCVVVAG